MPEYTYDFNILIHDIYQLQLFLIELGFENVISINTNNDPSIIIISFSEELSEQEYLDLETAVMTTYTNPQPRSSSTTFISVKNSSTSVLSPYSYFLGEYEDVSDYSSISVLISTNDKSKLNGIEFQFSTDKSSVDLTRFYTFNPIVGFNEIITPISKYFRIKYTNNNVQQTYFKLQTIYSTIKNVDPRSTTQSNSISIQEESSDKKTNGRFKSKGFSITSLANTTSTHDFSFNFDIAPLVVKFKTGEMHRGDFFDMYIAPGVIIGAILAPVSIGNNSFTLTASSFHYLGIGYRVSVTDGINTNDLGEVIGIDYTTNVVTTSDTFDNNFTAGSFVKMTIHTIENYPITEPGDHNPGDSKIGATYIPKNQIIRLVYTNNSNNDKIFAWNVEYLY